MKPFKTLICCCTAAITLFLFPACRKPDEPLSGVATARPNRPANNVTPIVPKWTSAPGEELIENLSWYYPWYNTLEIEHFTEKVPPGILFKVFIKRADSPDWIEIPLLKPDSGMDVKYEYFLGMGTETIYKPGNLYIFYYALDGSDHPSVKIVY